MIRRAHLFFRLRCNGLLLVLEDTFKQHGVNLFVFLNVWDKEGGRHFSLTFCVFSLSWRRWYQIKCIMVANYIQDMWSKVCAASPRNFGDWWNLFSVSSSWWSRPHYNTRNGHWICWLDTGCFPGDFVVGNKLHFPAEGAAVGRDKSNELHTDYNHHLSIQNQTKQ